MHTPSNMDKENIVPPTLPTASEARLSSCYFFIGSIASALLPFPLLIMWFGISMGVYGVFRHHPHPRVGYYVQLAAYHFYGIVGTYIPLITFATKDFFINYWPWLWLAHAIAIIPFATFQIIRIYRETWTDTPTSPSS